MKKHTVTISWPVRVYAYLDIEAGTPTEAMSEALRLVRDDRDTREDVAIQAYEAVRDSGADICYPDRHSAMTAQILEIEDIESMAKVLDHAAVAAFEMGHYAKSDGFSREAWRVREEGGLFG